MGGLHVGSCCRYPSPPLAALAVLLALTFGPPISWAQQTTAAVASPKAAGDKEQCSQELADAQPNGAPPAYKLLRYDEDYSYLKDPCRRTDFWDAISYIPLWDPKDWYLSVGGELRERYEFLRNEDQGI